MDTMFRLQLIDELLYESILDVESAIALARIALLHRRDAGRAERIMHKKFPELAELKTAYASAAPLPGASEG